MGNKMHLKYLILTMIMVITSPSYAYNFKPSEAEWAAWPGYCKAKYIWTNIGKQSEFVNRVSAADKTELEQWEQAGVYGAHHFCAGTSWLQRARLQSDLGRRSFELREAMSETLFTLQSTDPHSYRFPDLVTQLASIMYEKGELDAALKLLQDNLRNHPENVALYSAIAIIHWKRGALEDAKAILLRGDEALDSDSAEINYNLGLVLLKLGELDEAERRAQLAYELGYPLPGLRTKLKRLGRM